MNSTKNLGNISVFENYFPSDKKATRIIDEQVLFLHISFLFHFLLLININESIIQHFGQNYICLSIAIIAWLWTPEFGKN